MQKIFKNSDKAKTKICQFALLICAFLLLFSASFAQTKPKTVKTNAPKITKIDEVSIKKILVPRDKPLLVNFWATWCVPCREEFPDLVKIDEEFKGKIDFITISLDDLAEINRDVPKFLSEMKATMPAYLLNTNEESQVITSISKDWQGGLPFTILYDENGEVVHTKQGKIKPEIVKEKIYELLNAESPEDLDEDSQLKLKVSDELKNAENPFEQGKNDARKDLDKGVIKIIRYGEGNAETNASDKLLTQKFGIKFPNFGCKMTVELEKYIQGYNEIAQEKVNDASSIKTIQVSVNQLPEPKIRSTEEGKEDAKNDISKGILKIKRYGLTAAIPQDSINELKKKHGIEITENGCVLINTTAEYFTAYNEVMKAEISRKFGVKFLEKLPL